MKDAPSPGWLAFGWRVLLATFLLGALLVAAERGLDWTDRSHGEAARVGWLAGCLGAAVVVYFGTLLATGIKPRDFMRRA